MEENVFIPNGLPILPDHLLIRTLVEYEQVHALLTNSDKAGVRQTRSRIERAMEIITAELEARGLDAGIAVPTDRQDPAPPAWVSHPHT